ncbi:ATP-binding cassette domain-containing protein (plasmid) [Alicyclobacillus fastidiosus]|uniref:ATP-binding cassette domain-containing protein n=1 Tax=Alicyclobacillus fastidiosus TaxID=392011 RepID=A0ABY6ZRX8_9BACL|nr:oligopeptide/dipeptide ABC transporter ATP-binding protein [Alicyclobacillus fastidiosus]WAH44849.1 ATP-binding cassette domain-containing protein [Alicyclobacillus fastidiosus]GMA65817.1 ABC transporter ATP-binding protein [Alicyclobacillus fastidiosus]GMA65889.1 ABC transporter ATP-binding protein [Alicyclobacillus fastidiosus]
MELLQLRDLSKYFSTGKHVVKAVDGVTLTVESGKTLGLVGESGCGKSTTGRLMLGINKPTSGEIRFKGRNIHSLSKVDKKRYHHSVQMVFQDPYSSLDPRMTVENIIAEGMDVQGTVSGQERRDRVLDLVQRVGLRKDQLTRFPHEFSGGQRQRIGIARALAVNPELIIADEPISALDVSIQAQVMTLLQSLQADFGLSYVFISHDLAMVEYISDVVAVMYLGKIVEYGSRQEIYDHPQHPYTRTLMSAVPVIGKKADRIRLTGDVPSPTNLPKGCRFHTRCPFAEERCSREQPELKGNPGHLVACHLVN